MMGAVFEFRRLYAVNRTTSYLLLAAAVILVDIQYTLEDYCEQNSTSELKEGQYDYLMFIIGEILRMPPSDP